MVKFLKKFSFSTTYVKIFLSIILIATLALSISAFTLYRIFSRNSIKDIESISKKNLHQIYYNVNENLIACPVLSYKLFYDYDIFNAIYSDKNIEVDDSKIITKLSLLSSVNPFIHSIYLYNKNRDVFFNTINGIQSSSDFFDKDIFSLSKKYTLNMEQSKNVSNQITFTPHSITYFHGGHQTSSNILSFIAQDSTNNVLSGGALVVNLDVTKISNMIDSLNQDKANNLYILDEKKNIIVGQDKNTFLNHYDMDKYSDKIYKADEGSFTASIDGKKCLIVFYTLSIPNWKIISIYQYDLLLSNIKNILNTTLLICVIFFVIAILATILISGKLYAPIRNLVNISSEFIGTGKQTHSGKFNDELDYLSSALKETFVKVNTIELNSKNNTAFFKQELLKSLLLGFPISFKDIRNKFIEFNINLETENLAVIVLRIDDLKSYESNYNEQNQFLLNFAVCNVSSEILGKHYRCEALTISRDHNAIILNVNPKNNETLFESLKQDILNVQDSVKNYFNISVSAGICEVISDVKSLYQAYKTANDISSYNFVYGSGCILSQELYLNQDKDYKFPEESGKKFLEALNLGKIDAACEMLNNMFSEFKRVPLKTIKTSIFKLISDVCKISDEAFQVIAPYSIEQEVDSFIDINEAKYYLKDLIYKVHQFNENRNASLRSDVFDKILDFIGKEYKNSSFSINTVSEKLGLSINYIRLTFKEAANISFNEYLTNYRIEKAKDFLLTSSLTVNEISEATGFASATYFCTSFKKSTGMSPNIYRTQKKLNNPRTP